MQISFAVTAKLISAFIFATRIVQFLFYLNPKFHASSSFLCLYRSVYVGPVRKPHCWLSHEAAHFVSWKHRYVDCTPKISIIVHLMSQTYHFKHAEEELLCKWGVFCIRRRYLPLSLVLRRSMVTFSQHNNVHVFVDIYGRPFHIQLKVFIGKILFLRNIIITVIPF